MLPVAPTGRTEHHQSSTHSQEWEMASPVPSRIPRARRGNTPKSMSNNRKKGDAPLLPMFARQQAAVGGPTASTTAHYISEDIVIRARPPCISSARTPSAPLSSPKNNDYVRLTKISPPPLDLPASQCSAMPPAVNVAKSSSDGNRNLPSTVKKGGDRRHGVSALDPASISSALRPVGQILPSVAGVISTTPLAMITTKVFYLGGSDGTPSVRASAVTAGGTTTSASVKDSILSSHTTFPSVASPPPHMERIPTSCFIAIEEERGVGRDTNRRSQQLKHSGGYAALASPNDAVRRVHPEGHPAAFETTLTSSEAYKSVTVVAETPHQCSGTSVVTLLDDLSVPASEAENGYELSHLFRISGASPSVEGEHVPSEGQADTPGAITENDMSTSMSPCQLFVPISVPVETTGASRATSPRVGRQSSQQQPSPVPSPLPSLSTSPVDTSALYYATVRSGLGSFLNRAAKSSIYATTAATEQSHVLLLPSHQQNNAIIATDTSSGGCSNGVTSTATTNATRVAISPVHSSIAAAAAAEFRRGSISQLPSHLSLPTCASMMVAMAFGPGIQSSIGARTLLSSPGGPMLRALPPPSTLGGKHSLTPLRSALTPTAVDVLSLEALQKEGHALFAHNGSADSNNNNVSSSGEGREETDKTSIRLPNGSLACANADIAKDGDPSALSAETAAGEGPDSVTGSRLSPRRRKWQSCVDLPAPPPLVAPEGLQRSRLDGAVTIVDHYHYHTRIPSFVFPSGQGHDHVQQQQQPLLPHRDAESEPDSRPVLMAPAQRSAARGPVGNCSRFSFDNLRSGRSHYQRSLATVTDDNSTVAPTSEGDADFLSYQPLSFVNLVLHGHNSSTPRPPAGDTDARTGLADRLRLKTEGWETGGGGRHVSAMIVHAGNAHPIKAPPRSADGGENGDDSDSDGSDSVLSDIGEHSYRTGTRVAVAQGPGNRKRMGAGNVSDGANGGGGGGCATGISAAQQPLRRQIRVGEGHMGDIVHDGGLALTHSTTTKAQNLKGPAQQHVKEMRMVVVRGAPAALQSASPPCIRHSEYTSAGNDCKVRAAKSGSVVPTGPGTMANGFHAENKVTSAWPRSPMLLNWAGSVLSISGCKDNV